MVVWAHYVQVCRQTILSKERNPGTQQNMPSYIANYQCQNLGLDHP